jgi:hypothetical protein
LGVRDCCICPAVYLSGMISKEELREKIIHGEFARLSELFPQWPVSTWAKVMGVRESNIKKKIAGTFKFILRDAVTLSQYFDIQLSVTLDLLEAEMQLRERDRHFFARIAASKMDVQDMRRRTLYKIIDLLYLYLTATNPAFVAKSPKGQQRELLREVTDLLKRFDALQS